MGRRDAGTLAVALSVSGLYGVLIYLLGQRTREIGIRMALGASRAAIARLVAAHSARLASIGAAVGVAAATASLGILGSLVPLRNVTWIDRVSGLLTRRWVGEANTP